MSGLSYEKSGVNYDRLDAFSLRVPEGGRHHDAAAGDTELSSPGIRGDSRHLIETPEEYLAHVEEGLGTKNLIADAMLALADPGFTATSASTRWRRS